MTVTFDIVALAVVAFVAACLALVGVVIKVGREVSREARWANEDRERAVARAEKAEGRERKARSRTKAIAAQARRRKREIQRRTKADIKRKKWAETKEGMRTWLEAEGRRKAGA